MDNHTPQNRQEPFLTREEWWEWRLQNEKDISRRFDEIDDKVDNMRSEIYPRDLLKRDLDTISKQIVQLNKPVPQEDSKLLKWIRSTSGIISVTIAGVLGSGSAVTWFVTKFLN